MPPSETKTDKTEIAFLGGCGEFGMNLTALYTGKRLFVIDSGVKFTEPWKLGTDAVFPDIRPLIERYGPVHSYILTHGHEDHIGALPYMYRTCPAPVYATPWTAHLLALKLLRLNIAPEDIKVMTVEAGDTIRTDGFEAEFIHVNHSIPMACSLLIKCGGLKIFHTGDFKTREFSSHEAPYNWDRVRAIGQDGIDLLLSDSTNADKDGDTGSEDSVYGPICRFLDSCSGAAIITTFSSNLWRLIAIARACADQGRRLYITGAGFETTLKIAANLKIYQPPPGLLLTEAEVENCPRHQLSVLSSGCQAEMRSSLVRIANCEHRYFKAMPGDRLLFSSRIIPGNEANVFGMINKLCGLGVDVASLTEYRDAHVSGHASGGEITTLAHVLKPTFAMPVHGGTWQLEWSSRRIRDGFPACNVYGVSNGDVFLLSGNEINRLDPVPSVPVYIDTDSGKTMTQEGLRSRLRIGEWGLVTVTGVYDRQRRKWLVKPDVLTTGIAMPEFPDASDPLKDLRNELAAIPGRFLQKSSQSGDIGDISEELRIVTRRYFHRLVGKKPVAQIQIHFLDAL